MQISPVSQSFFTTCSALNTLYVKLSGGFVVLKDAKVLFGRQIHVIFYFFKKYSLNETADGDMLLAVRNWKSCMDLHLIGLRVLIDSVFAIYSTLPAIQLI